MSYRRDPAFGYIDTGFWVPKTHVNMNALSNALTFTPAGTRGTKEPIRAYREEAHHVCVPREYWRPDQFPFVTYDMRPRAYATTGVRSSIQLDHRVGPRGLEPTGTDLQKQALSAMLRARGGVLQLGCGRGKSIIALKLIERLQTPALIVVDTTMLLDQWQEEIARHMTVPGGVGLIQAGKMDWQKSIVMATYNTLALRAEELPDEIRRWFGVCIWDECHMIDAPTFSRSAGAFYGRRYGLSATPERSDGMNVLHEAHIGEVLYKDLRQDLTPRVVFYQTHLAPDVQDPKIAQRVYDSGGEIHFGLLSSYMNSWEERRKVVIKRIRERAAQGGKILVLGRSVDGLATVYADWVGSAEKIGDIVRPSHKELGLPYDVPMTPRQLLAHQKKLSNPKTKPAEHAALKTALDAHAAHEAIERAWEKRKVAHLKRLTANQTEAVLLTYKVLPSMESAQKSRVAFSIFKYGKQAYNDKALDTVVLLDPVSDPGMLQQILGRVLRHKEGKLPPLCLVFEDDFHPLVNMCRKMRSILINMPPDEGGPYPCVMENLITKEAIRE